jgi:hypothetical protein
MAHGQQENTMSTPQRPSGVTPPRADPLQPDRPPRGLDIERPDGPPKSGDAAKELRKKQQQNARDDGGRATAAEAASRR